MGSYTWLLPTLTILLLPSVYGQGRVYTTCEALATGFESSVGFRNSRDLATYCTRVDPLEARAFSAAATSPGASITVDGEETTVSNIPARDGVAVSSSSFGMIPIKVIGGSDRDEMVQGVFTRLNPTRPEGPWYAIISVDVAFSKSAVFSQLRDLRRLYGLGFRGLGVNVTRLTSKSVRVFLASGGTTDFVQESLSTTFGSVVSRFRNASETIFPGFELEDSRIYVQVLERRDSKGSTIEIGWGPQDSGEIEGNVTTGVKQVEALLLEMSANFENEFGQLCELALDVRTIEGDCNSLDDPSRASANSALRRLGEDIDPAYPGGDPDIPSGPLDINVRDISNALFGMSPGSRILKEQVQALENMCGIANVKDGTEFIVCPLKFIKKVPNKGQPTKIPFVGILVNECEELIFRFETSYDCTIDVLLKCAGEQSVDLADNPCGAETNRFFDPVGCVIAPGEDSVLANSAGLTDLFFTMAQFIDHDYSLSPLSQINPEQPGFSRLARPLDVEPDFPIDVPEGDFHFPDRDEFEFTRAEFSDEDPLSQVNLHSSYLDGSQIYGVDFERSRLLRSFKGGRLALSEGDLLPFNSVDGPGALGAVVANGPNMGPEFFVAGDSRSNEQLLLTAMHTMFLREHNLVADEVSEAFPEFDDEQIYQTARAIVIAEFQCIVYTEFLPLLLGKSAPDPREFIYDPDLDATVSAIFTTSAFRFGHSLVGTNLLLMEKGSRAKANMTLMPIRDVFFSPEVVAELDGIDPLVRGATWHLCKELDHKIVDELRNFLVIDFEEDVVVPPLFDLVSINLQRGRDLGLPSFNDIRVLFDLKPYKKFKEFIADPNLADLAEEVYQGDIDLVEPFFGGLAEEQILGGQLGETFNAVITDQFVRARDGDRFFYTGLKFDKALVKAIPRVKAILEDEVRLGDIIVRTTNVTLAEIGASRESVFKID